MNFYANKSVLITGGSSGIGLALSTLLVGTCRSLTILSRQKERLAEASDQLQQLPGSHATQISTLQADITKRDEISLVLDDYLREYGNPDIVINCAGAAHPGTFTSLDPEIFDWLMNVNYFGTVNVLKSLVPGMKSRKSGIIVNISSIAGFLGIYGYTAYSASKFAITGFSDALRSELKPYGIQLSIVFPPDTKTPQLDYEDQFKPYITQQLSSTANLMSAENVAKEILKKVAKRKYMILPGSEGKLLFTAKNLLGKSLYPIMDLLVNDAIRKLKLGE
ncbi:MAG: SDR family oxidoreductase [Anaerolineaceae bacterium]|nr:SDR family oxidoreductase [Anaerolineaceae bacterium]